MSCEGMRQECKEAFGVLHDRIDKRDRKLDRYSERLDEHDREITANATDIKHLAKSMSALTKSLWGIASAIIVAALTLSLIHISEPTRH